MKIRAALAAAWLALAAGAAFAQPAAWPARPVTVVVPSSPGGGTDAYGRIIAQALGDQLHQTFVVENRPGASGNIGADYVAKAQPDGYTLLVASNSSLGINPVLYKTLSYDADRDLVAISRGVMAPMVVVVFPDPKLKTLADLLNRGKAEPGKHFYGSAGVGSPPYIGALMIADAGGAEFVHIPYKGVGPAYADLIAGRLDFMYTDLASVLPFVTSGKVVALAVNEKTPLLPNVPTLAEAGYPNVRAWTSFSVMGPGKLPDAIVKRLADAVAAAMHTPAVAQRLAQQALVPVFDTPPAFALSLKDERQHWGAFIRKHQIKPE
jgi:tripartite-type tricarboxylate transporter receptor subunit TctC